MSSENGGLEDTTHKSFAELMGLKKIGAQVWRSTSKPFTPMPGASGVFGGHVLAQSILAATNTTGTGFRCVSSLGHFIKGGNPDCPFVYVVKTLRDSHKFCQRLVEVYQFEDIAIDELDKLDELSQERLFKRNGDIAYIATIALKRPESNNDELNFQVPFPEQFARSEQDILKMPLATDQGSPIFVALAEKLGVVPQWHPIDCRKMDTKAFNRNFDSITDQRIIHHLKSLFPMDDPNHHLALLAYISDRNSLFTITDLYDPTLPISRMASINHTLVFHVTDDIDTFGSRCLMETWTDRATDGRGLYGGRIYDGRKRLVASFMQDGIVKVLHEATAKI